MTRRRIQTALATLSIAALGAAACSSSPAGSTGMGGAGGAVGTGGAVSAGGAGAGGAGCPAASASVACTPDLAWYVIGDSQPLAPDPASGAYCASGAVPAGSDGTPGGGLAVDFNAAGNSGGTKGIWDARSYGGVAFDFTGGMVPAQAMRVSFPFAGQGPDGPPFYQGTAQPYSALADGQHVVIHWDAIGGPYGAASPVLFDPSKLQSMQVQVLGSASAPMPYQFCVANLSALPD